MGMIAMFVKWDPLCVFVCVFIFRVYSTYSYLSLSMSVITHQQTSAVELHTPAQCFLFGDCSCQPYTAKWVLWPIRTPLRWRHNDHAGVSNHQPRGCLLNRLFRRKSKKTSKLRVTGLCAGNSPGTGEFPAQMASNAENVSIGWRHHAISRSRAVHEMPYFINKTKTSIVDHFESLTFAMVL